MFSCHVDLMLSHVDATAAVQTQKHVIDYLIITQRIENR